MIQKTIARASRWLPALFALLVLALPASAQITTGSIFGTVKDSTGSVIPKATVTLTNQAVRFTREVTTNATGDFVAANLPTGDYTIAATAKGFAPLVKTGVVLDIGSRLSIGNFELKVGTAAESVTVSASGGEMQLQAESGERALLIDKTQIDDLMMNGRNILDFMKIIPGVNSTFNGVASNKGGLDSMNFNGSRGNAHTINVDGIANEDNGANNAVQVTVNTDAIGEVKVMTSNFQAEYGKASGGQISMSILNGTSDFHGNLRYFYRGEWMNANSWFNNQTNYLNRGTSNAALTPDKRRFQQFGGQIGGPVLLPHFKYNEKRDKLFFFYSHEYYHQVLPGGTDTLTVPTNAEIAGDFSASKDGYNNALSLSDPGGVGITGNKLPSASIYAPIQQIFKSVYPRPNATDPTGRNGYNYMFQTSYEHPRQEEILRIDWQANRNNRLFAHYVNNQDSEGCPLGCDGVDGISNVMFPGGMHMNEPGYNTSFDLTTTISPTMVNEITAGWSVNKLEVSATNGNIYRSTWNINLPLLYAVGSDSPIPDFSFGGINNQSLPWTYLGSMPFNNALTVINITDNLTKTFHNHTLKAGVFVERSRKDQASWGNSNGSFNFDGQATGQALQTGNPFANALLGYYTSFQQSSARPRGYYRYTQLDFYLQDTWKLTRRLTLDLGIRFPWFQPQYDAHYQSAVFNPTAWDSTQTVRLYHSTGSYAFDPANPSVQINNAYAGMIVPNSGNPANGIVTAQNGSPKGGYKDAGFLFEPRVGFAYDLFGNGKTILRGGFGISHDRLQGNPVYNQVASNPPNVYTPQLKFGTIQGLASIGSGSNILAPGTVYGFDQTGKVPTTYSYSLGFQRDLGKGIMLDVAYVGNKQQHMLQMRNLNYIPYGATFQAANQNPYHFGLTYGQAVPSSCNSSWQPSQYTAAGYKCMGTDAMDQVYLAPYQGYGNVDWYIWDGVANYNSLQVQMNRRFGHLFKFGGAYTWSKTMDTTDSDASWVNVISQKKYNYQLAGMDRAGNLAVNYIFYVPKLSQHFGGNKLVSYVTDNWEVSGVSLFISGPPASVGISTWYSSKFITGSYSEPSGIYLKPGVNPVVSRHGRAAAVNPNAFQMPNIGTPNVWPKQYIRTGGSNDTDLALMKRIPLSGPKKVLELRLETFNTFNHPQFYGRNLGTSPDVNTDTSGANINNYWGWAWNWSNVVPVSPANVRPANTTNKLGTYFGDYNSSSNSREIQLAAKFHF